MRKIDKIIIHCSATPPSRNIGAVDIKRWHTSPCANDPSKPWRDIGYHHVIKRNGVIENGRNRDVAGVHTKGQNANSLGICMVGGVDAKMQPQSNFTPLQWATLERLIRILKADFPWATVHGHNEFAAKACPSFDVQAWLKGKII